MSSADKMKKVQRALIDYLVERRGDADVSIEVFGYQFSLFFFFFCIQLDFLFPHFQKYSAFA